MADILQQVEVYSTSNQNIQLSGGNTIQIVPRKSPTGQWTSGRIESQSTFTPAPGKIMIVEGLIRFGSNGQGNKQGMWPAFWMLGDSVHHGTPWPQCGELDIMEQVNGILTGYGTAHCGSNPGGACNEPIGKSATVNIADDNFHAWTIKIDRTNSDNFQAESITWLLDGTPYQTLTGADIGDQGTWATLAHSPLFIILNLAVGGDCTFPPFFSLPSPLLPPYSLQPLPPASFSSSTASWATLVLTSELQGPVLPTTLLWTGTAR